ncbi:rhodanese-like domain-containing protein [Hoeflea olei]|uniref:Rhodanese domain-containing protein n=1 Tax=Hoeflea olei TaxID=1480615 RepID=A0A1C1YTD3_9HYPH|nr:rhodanese-like domain-containing protein [Hoeflea olei]OCW56754.1 hypothetical protein AWJ14_17680 [Hoeflea olei]
MAAELTRRLVLAAAALVLAAPCLALAQEGLRNVTPREAYAALEADPSIAIIDIRTPQEFAEGHIEGATNIDFYARDFIQQFVTLDPARTYLIYCRSGNRSGKLMQALAQSPYRNVMNVSTGLSGWQNEGLPTVK